METKNSLEFEQGQLKRVGMLDALTPELKTKLLNNPGTVVETFTRKYDKDSVDVKLHFRKSTRTANSFLNKFDMHLKKEDGREVKQTFYIPPESKLIRTGEMQQVRHDNKYTMKEAYNLLSGRPVFKNLLSKDGEPYQAWVKMDTKSQLLNGNHELKQYNQNYGFNLDNVLKEYSIKERANPEYYKNLKESIERGNLQKVTFVGKEGKVEQLYVTPSITTATMNVHYPDGKRVPLERLLNDGYISQALADKLKQQFAQKADNSASQQSVAASDKGGATHKVEENKSTQSNKEQTQSPSSPRKRRIKNP